MTETEFNKLDMRQKADVVWEWGYYLGSRKSALHTIALFLINDFFCEVYINLTDNKTDEITNVAYNNLHTDFQSVINFSNPLIKAALKKSSRTQQA